MQTLLKIIIVFYALMGVFNFVTRKYVNPYKLYLVFGKKGSGKSTYLTRVALTYLRKGWKVYTNMPDMSIPGVRYYDTDNFGDFTPDANSCLLLDEVGMIFDNRNFKNFKPSVRDFFKLQRHYKCVIYMASQTFDVDKKIRDLTDGMFLQTNLFRVFTLGRRIRRSVTLMEAQGDSESRIVENLKWCPFWEWTLTFIPKYAGKFDSSITPELKPMPYKEVEGELAPTFKQRIKSLFRKPVDALHQLKRSREEVQDEEADDFPYAALDQMKHSNAPDAPLDDEGFGF